LVLGNGFGVGESNGAIFSSIKSNMAADGHLGMTALSRVTLALAGLSCWVWFNHGIFGRVASFVHA